jgi:hypothetical protein
VPIPSTLQPHLVTVELLTATGTDASGGTVTGNAVVVSNVACLISQGSGRPDQRFEQQQGVTRYTVTGNSPHIARLDVRFLVTRGPRQGEYLRVIGVSEAGPAGTFSKFYRAVCEELVTG